MSDLGVFVSEGQTVLIHGTVTDTGQTGDVPNNGPAYDGSLLLTVSVEGLDDLNVSVAYRVPATVDGIVIFLPPAYGTSDWSAGGDQATKEQEIYDNCTLRNLIVLSTKWDEPGWLTAAFGTPTGPKQLASRVAALVRYLRTLHPEGTLTIVGQSAGCSALAYILALYGLDDLVDRAIFSSGPPHADIPHIVDVGPGEAQEILAASWGRYDPVNVRGAGFTLPDDVLYNYWWADESCGSNLTDLDWPTTDVAFVFGKHDDTGSAENGLLLCRALRDLGRIVPRACVDDQGHPMNTSGIQKLWPLLHSEPVVLLGAGVGVSSDTSITVDLVVNGDAEEVTEAGTDMNLAGALIYAVHYAATTTDNVDPTNTLTTAGFTRYSAVSGTGFTITRWRKIADGTEESVTVPATDGNAGAIHQELALFLAWNVDGTPDLAYSTTGTSTGVTVGPTSITATDAQIAFVTVATTTDQQPFTDFTPAFDTGGFYTDYGSGHRMIVGSCAIHQAQTFATATSWAASAAYVALVDTLQ